MMNDMIPRALKAARKQNHLSVKDVAVLLNDRSMVVAEKTIYGWESGQAQPNADTLLQLCEIYHIDNILETFGYEESPMINITEFEKDLILNLRKHPEMLDAVKKLLDMK